MLVCDGSAQDARVKGRTARVLLPEQHYDHNSHLIFLLAQLQLLSKLLHTHFPLVCCPLHDRKGLQDSLPGMGRYSKARIAANVCKTSSGHLKRQVRLGRFD